MREERIYHFGFRKEVLVGKIRVKFSQRCLYLACEFVIHVPSVSEFVVFLSLFKTVAQNKAEIDRVLDLFVRRNVREKIVLDDDAAKRVDEAFEFLEY